MSNKELADKIFNALSGDSREVASIIINALKRV